MTKEINTEQSEMVEKLEQAKSKPLRKRKIRKNLEEEKEPRNQKFTNKRID